MSRSFGAPRRTAPSASWSSSGSSSKPPVVENAHAHSSHQRNPRKSKPKTVGSQGNGSRAEPAGFVDFRGITGYITSLIPMIPTNIAQIRRRMGAACARAGRAVRRSRSLRCRRRSGRSGTRGRRRRRHGCRGELRPGACRQARGRLRARTSDGISSATCSRTRRSSLSPWVHLIHAVDRPTAADGRPAGAARTGSCIDVLVEVNTTGESSKYGVPPEDVGRLSVRSRRARRSGCAGLMTIGPFLPDPEGSRPMFRQLRGARGGSLAELGQRECRHAPPLHGHDRGF